MNILGLKERFYTVYSELNGSYRTGSYLIPLKQHLRKAAVPFLFSLLISVSGCKALSEFFDSDKHDFIDRAQELNREDYRNMPVPKGKATDKEKRAGNDNRFEPYIDGPPVSSVEIKEPPIPDITTILATPKPPAIGETQLVSIFVTQDVALKDVLIELARLADVDIEIDAAIEGGIVFRAQNRPFNEVIDRISSLAGLRYEMKNGVLRVERDTETVKTYALDFLSFKRSSTSDVNLTTSVLSSGGGSSGGGGGGGSGLNSGSSAAITYTAESDFWEKLGTAIEGIVAYKPANGLKAANTTADLGMSMGGGSGTGAAGESFYVLNRQGGTLTVAATSRQHAMIEQYLKELREATAAQVLIEAKIVEVNLDDQYSSGINWNELLRGKVFAIDADYPMTAPVNSTTGARTQILIGGTSAADPSLDAIVNLTQQFGTTRTLSSPRLHAMNNQQAVLTFAENLVYFDISIERETDTNSGSGSQELFTVDAQPITVPVGIIISLQPAINAKTGEITLSIRPTLSRVTRFVSDPSVAFIQQNTNNTQPITNLVPQIEVRELDSLMRMKSGQVMVLGGLMEQVGDNVDEGIPFISGIPWVGNAFKSATKREQVRELFILVKATIVGNTSSVGDTDKNIYKKFTGDHRPLAF